MGLSPISVFSIWDYAARMGHDEFFCFVMRQLDNEFLKRMGNNGDHGKTGSKPNT